MSGEGVGSVSLKEVDFDPFAVPELSKTAPSTESQREIWAAAQIGDDASAAFNESISLTLEGHLDIAAFDAAVQDLVARHESLRTTFSSDGLTLCIASQLTLDIEVQDLAGLDSREQGTRVQAVRRQEVETPFRLERGPLFRVRILRLAKESHLVTLSAHHIVCDGWSMAVMLNDLAVLYSARLSGQRASMPAASSFTEYATEERTHEHSPEYGQSEKFWQEKLKGTLPILDLPLDGVRPPSKSYSSIREDYVVPSALVEQVKKAGAKNGASFFATLLSAFYVLLGRLSGDEDIVVGIPAAGQSVTGKRDLVGHCVNTLPLRVQVDRNASLSSFFKIVRGTMLDAFDNQRCTFGSILKKVSLPRDPSRLPLVSVLFNVDQAVNGDSLEFEGLRVSYESNPRSFENFEIFVNAAEARGQVVLECQFNADLFSRDTIRRWLGAYEELLRGIASGEDRPIGALPILPVAERSKLIYGWNATFTDFERTFTVHRAFEEQAAKTPELPAVVFGDRSITFGALDARSNQVARRLRAMGVRRDALVGLSLERSIDMVVALVGILKAGAAYVPLDPAFPPDRLALMIEDSGIQVLVSETRLDDVLPKHACTTLRMDADVAAIDAESTEGLPRDDDAAATPESVAYVIYTSGSTGKPKGVRVPHRAVVNFLESMAREPGVSGADTLLAVTTLSFDIAVLELHLPLTVGAKIVLASREMATDGALLKQAIEVHGVTVMQATPSTWRLLLAAGWKGDAGFKILCGGEALPRDLAGELVRRAGSVWNMYGPTETTVWSTCSRIEDPNARIVIGKPIANTQVYVLDERLEPVPVGVPGELYIGGDGVTKGYLNRPDLTTERFVSDPFSGDTSSIMYRTGDLVRHLPDGNLEYLRRNDHQVKLRGYRIELGEIETALSKARGVEQAVVVVKEITPGDSRLVGYVVASGSSQTPDGDLRTDLKKSLPDYMVPQHFVWLDALPLTPNGKIDRKALPAPSLDRNAVTGEFVAPRTPSEAIVAKIFCDVLGLSKVSANDNFFDLGGHSLVAAQVFSRLDRDHGVVLPLRKMFEAPTVERLAKLVDAVSGSGAEAAPKRIAIPRRDDSKPAPLSLMQQRLWMLEQLDPGLSVQNLPSAFRIRGALDVAKFERAVNAVASRHDATRMRFESNYEDVYQDVVSDFTIRLQPVIDLSTFSDPVREAKLLHTLEEDARSPFDLVTGPLVRGALFRLAPEEHVFFWMAHHAVWDGWSFDVFLSELDTTYAALVENRPVVVPELPIRYRDFAEWHREWLQGEELERQAEYWLEHLKGELPVLEMPLDRPRPARASYTGATEEFILTPAQVTALTALGRKADATLYMVLLAAFDTLLYRYTGQEDIVIGTPIRGRTWPETENLIGFFVNTLVLRTSLADQPSFLEVVERVRKVSVDAFGHPDMPFELLVQRLGVPRDLSRTPVFQAFFTYQDVSKRQSKFGALPYSQIHVHAPVAPTDLYLWVKETGHGLIGGIDYATDLFERETIQRFLKQLHRLLTAVCENPAVPISQVAILPEAERRFIQSVNATDTPYERELGVHRLVERTALANPERVAVVHGGASLTYGELETRAHALAGRLAALGARTDSLVGICLERSHDMVIAMLAVLKTGAAYVPLDPAFPPDRLAFMVEDARLSVIVTQKSLASDLPPHAASVALVDDTSDAAGAPPSFTSRGTLPQSAAYVIYTSGSTGKPKGVVVPHGAVVNFLSSIAKTPGLTEKDTLLAVTTLSFDIAVLELWLPLTLGAKIVLASREQATDGEQLLALARQSHANVVQATPATYRLLLEGGLATGDFDRALIGGEAVPADLARDVAAKVNHLWNMYGPTETTVWSTCVALPANVSRVTIGRPLQNTRVYVVDKHGQICPVGVPGELWIGGDGVATEYLRRPELTDAKFSKDPFAPDGRVYRTGDVVRLLADGTLEYLRRNDNQVKLRGYRIELGEIESALQQHPAVRHAVAIVREDRPGDARLVAYVVKSEDVMDSELRTHLRQFLPDYMLPAHFVDVPEMPLTPNGKVDRKALPPPFATQALEDDFVEPTTAEERLVAEIWKAALGTDRISVHDNFFTIGGHSLLSLKVIAQIERRTGVRLSPRVLLLNSLLQVAAHLPKSSESATVVPAPVQSTPAPRPQPAASPTKDVPLAMSLLRRVKRKILG